MQLGVLINRIDKYEQTKRNMRALHIDLVDEFEFKILDDSGRVIKHYQPCKTAIKFHADRSDVKAVKGPVGSGKSTFCLADTYLTAIKMPQCTDGIRRQRTLFVRNTYKDLLTSTFRTWQAWFSGLGNLYERSAPWIYKCQEFNDKDGKIILEIDGFSCDRHDQLESFSSVEFTTAYLNEARALPDGVLNRIRERLGRFPSVEQCPNPFWHGVTLDTNPPSTHHWFYKVFERDKPKGFKIFYQPPGLVEDKTTDTGYKTNLDAENTKHLPPDYYLKLAAGKSKEEIKVQLMGEYGIFAAGQCVYSQYNDNLHAVSNLKVDENFPIIVGWDFGLTPAALIMQKVRGQLRAIKEFVSTFTASTEELAKNQVLPWLTEHAPHCAIKTFHDKSDKRSETNLMQPSMVLAELGLNPEASRTNNLEPRLNAVKSYLDKLVEGQPAFVLDKENCPFLREGFLGNYHHKKINQYSDERYREEPEKNHPYSDIHDCLQYGALGDYHEIDLSQFNSSKLLSPLSESWL